MVGRRKRHGDRARRAAALLLEAGAAAAFLGAVLHHVYTFNFKPLAAFCLPVLVVLFGFTSLLYMRGRSLARGREQLRTLYAAERAMQAAVWYVTGVVLGTGLYGLLQYLDYSFDPLQPTAQGWWLLVFVAPAGLMQAGLLLFLRAAGVIAPQFLRPVGAREIWRRIAHAP